MKSFQAQTHYEVLEISVSASADEVKSAFERLSRLYGDDQVVLYGMVDGGRAAALRARLKQAFEVLTDDDQRDRYDVSIGLPPRDLPPTRKAPAPRASAPAAASAATGWGTFEWVTPTAPVPSAPAGPVSFTVPAPAQVLPAPVVAASSPPPPVPSAPPPAPLAPSPAPGLGLKLLASPETAAPAIEVPAVASQPPALAAEAPAPPPPVAPTPPPLAPLPPVGARAAPPAPVLAEPVVAEALPAEAPSEDDDTPRLADEVEVSIVPLRTNSREFRIEARPKPYEVPPGVEFNGDLLRQVRMARGLSLMQLSERTRIGVKHLENVEGDRYDALPVGVYLRGILMSLARELGLDGLRVSKSYLTFVEAHRSKG